MVEFSRWDNAQVAQWLGTLGCSQYAINFRGIVESFVLSRSKHSDIHSAQYQWREPDGVGSTHVERDWY